MIGFLIVWFMLFGPQCLTCVDNGIEHHACFSRTEWVLEYHCDQSTCSDEYLQTGESHPVKVFASKQEAIDWIQQNYQYAPGSMWHEGIRLTCAFKYLNEDDPDEFTKRRKSVECDTDENLWKGSDVVITVN